ncbi:M4 family metallopeptidase [Couchioplanes caeruleus subsp. azureus]|uniref:M4 family metallopeptidase n=2 Tax=Couchioplanes caeruleus TaxID=56438 RepID=UPI00360A3B14
MSRAHRRTRPRMPVRATIATMTAAGVIIGGTATATAAPTPPSPAPDAGQARRLAAEVAGDLVAGRPAYLHASANDAFTAKPVLSSGPLQFVPYERTHRGLPVVGGDFVVVTDSSGHTRYTSVAQKRPIGDISLTPTITAARAEKVARGQLPTVTGTEDTRLVVFALSGTPRLAWQSTVVGRDQDGPSRLTVEVDAASGAVLHTQDHVVHGSGTGALNGPSPLKLETTSSGGTFSMTDPKTRNLSCQDYDGNKTFEGPDDEWGDGKADSRETGCTDALFVAQTQAKMLTEWLGRDGMDGEGGAWPIRIGLDDQNAFYDGTQVVLGHNADGGWVASLDVVGHEIGHGIDDHTPGGISGKGTQEFVADTFGAMTEWYANEPQEFDAPDYTVGEAVDLIGRGPIRNMYDPSKVGHDNCYSGSTDDDEVHAAAGPGNHWFYLLAEGSKPTNGQPESPTCNNSSVTGVGLQKAAKIMYTAMLMKTSDASYPAYRTWTLRAAKDLFAGSCAEFDTVKAAWDAVSVRARSGDPTCSA